MLIFSLSSVNQFLAQSVIVPLLLATIAIAHFKEEIFSGFELYSGLDGLYSMFANEALLLIFWLHFLAISLFAGSWIVRDSKKYFIPKVITIPSLILTYLTGPIGVVIYWLFRVFFARKISFND